MKPAVLGYVRVSTEEQAREGISLEMQRDKIRQYCLLNELGLTEIVEDAGISGKSIKRRPGIQSVLERVRYRKVNAVVCYKLDRIGRNTVEILNMSQAMDKAGVALHSITEKLDTKSPIGKFFFTLIASLAEMERNVIAERTSAALAQKKANGEKTGGSCPYGYRVEAGKLVADLGEHRAITRIRELRDLGYSYRKICEALTDEGTFTRKGTPFRETQIIRILKYAA